MSTDPTIINHRGCATPTINNTTSAKNAAAAAASFRPYSAALTETASQIEFRPIANCHHDKQKASGMGTKKIASPAAQQKNMQSLKPQQPEKQVKQQPEQLRRHQSSFYTHHVSQQHHVAQNGNNQVPFTDISPSAPPSASTTLAQTSATPIPCQSPPYPAYYAHSPVPHPPQYVAMPHGEGYMYPSSPMPSADTTASLQHQVCHLRAQIQHWEQWANGWHARMDQLAADREAAVQAHQADKKQWQHKMHKLERANRSLMAQLHSLQKRAQRRKRSLVEANLATSTPKCDSTGTGKSALSPRREISPWQVPHQNTTPLTVSPIQDLEQRKLESAPESCALPCLTMNEKGAESTRPLPLKKRRVREPVYDEKIERATTPPSKDTSRSNSTFLTPRLGKWNQSPGTTYNDAVPVTPSYEKVEMPFMPR